MRISTDGLLVILLSFEVLLAACSATAGYLLGVEHEAETSTRAIRELERCTDAHREVMDAGARALHIVEREDLSLTGMIDQLAAPEVDH